ncbi:hypothetical protein ACJU26_09085 [Acidithiobacillus sp. M4-SHS-6]|uniref:hypothetical protein n=1 Tax=Acidithiobacillus sp. M4-SHS-6 TaxID=3383024 RepID=UPI0039BE6021
MGLAAILCIAIPVGVLQTERWHVPMKQRRELALNRIFGGESAAIAFSLTLTETLADTKDLSIVAFPMGGNWLERLGDGFGMNFYLLLVSMLLYFRGHISGFIETSFIFFAVFWIPVTLSGFLIAFGNWKIVSNMRYPVAIFLFDIANT